MNEIVVNNEFKNLIPKLTEVEYELLEKSIIAEGCREALILWENTIVDGHNRYEICIKNNIQFKTTQKEFSSIAEAKEWIIKNQFGRRNINLYQRSILALTLKGLYQERAKEKQYEGRNQYSLRPMLAEASITTRDELAKVSGVSHGNISKVEKIQEKCNEEIKQQLTSGDITINQAFNEIKKQEVKASIEKQIEDIKTLTQPDGLFDLIVFDPPWNYGREYDPELWRVGSPYPEMSIEELSKIELPASDNSILCLWTTQHFIWEAKKLMDIYGFYYKGMIVWNKEKLGTGMWLRFQCEFCLVGIKGKPIWASHDIRDIITEPRREHSRKPNTFYQMIEDNFYGRFLDYFSRNQFSNKWAVFGNDTNRFKK